MQHVSDVRDYNHLKFTLHLADHERLVKSVGPSKNQQTRCPRSKKLLRQPAKPACSRGGHVSFCPVDCRSCLLLQYGLVDRSGVRHFHACPAGVSPGCAGTTREGTETRAEATFLMVLLATLANYGVGKSGKRKGKGLRGTSHQFKYRKCRSRSLVDLLPFNCCFLRGKPIGT